MPGSVKSFRRKGAPCAEAGEMGGGFLFQNTNTNNNGSRKHLRKHASEELENRDKSMNKRKAENIGRQLIWRAARYDHLKATINYIRRVAWIVLQKTKGGRNI